MKVFPAAIAASAVLFVPGCLNFPRDVDTNSAVSVEKRDVDPWSHEIHENSENMLKEGREIFRYDTFGSEAFWGGQLQLHRAIAPSLKPFQDLLGVDHATVVKVLNSWGPGKYDAELDKDGKAARPDGKSGATMIPAAFGLAGVNLHTYNGWGSVPYWNAYVA